MRKMDTNFMSRMLHYLWKDDSFLHKTYCVFDLKIQDWKEFQLWETIDSINNDICTKKFSSNKNIELKKRIIEFYAKEWVLFCPYCWINQYQKTPKVNWNEVMSFELDHFLDKWTYSQYACSLYNLIPVCMYCNQRLKHTNSITSPSYDKKQFFHIIYGRLQWNKNEKKFIQTENSNFDDIIESNVDIPNETFSNFRSNKNKSFQEWHIDFFRLNQIYQQSPIIKNELCYIRDKIQDIDNNWANIRSIWLNPVKLFFTHYPTTQEDILKHSAGKLKKDILNNIKQRFKY